MKRKISTIVICTLVFLSGASIVGLSQSTSKVSVYDKNTVLSPLSTIYVDASNTQGPWDGTIEHPYQYIQDGVTNAFEGDTVFVFAGIYDEMVTINKAIHLIGEDAETVIVQSTDAMQVIDVTANYVEISSLTARNAYRGIRIENAMYTTIEDCILTNNLNGLTPENAAFTNITDCLFINNSFAGVSASTAPSLTCLNSTFTDMQAGLYLYDCSSSTIEYCTFHMMTLIDMANGGTAIYFENSYDTTIENCSMSNCSDYGIFLYYCGNNIITECMFLNNTWNPDAHFPNLYHSTCVFIYSSPSCQITNCQYYDNDNGLFISGGSGGLFLRNNIFVNNKDGSLDFKGGPVEDYYLDIDSSNTIDGKPIMYLIGESDLTFDGSTDVSFLGLVSCTNITVTGITLEGLLMVGTIDSTLDGVISQHTKTGFLVSHSSACVITNCEAYHTATGFFGSSDSMVDCIAHDNEVGFAFPPKGKGDSEQVSAGNVTNCIAYHNQIGFSEAGYSVISNCNAYENTQVGFILQCGETNPQGGSILRNNQFFNNTYNFYASGWNGVAGYTLHDVDTSNMVNGRPIYYLIDQNDLVLDGAVIDVGDLILIDCDNVTVKNVDISNNSCGILMISTSHSQVIDSSFTGNQYGIMMFFYSTYNQVLNSMFTLNEYGVATQESSSFNRIVNCELNENSRFGYWSQVTQENTLSHCSVHDNGYAYSENEDVYPLSLQYGGPGIMIHYQTYNNLIENCSVYNNYEGIYVFSDCNGQLIRNCTIYNNTIDGLAIRETSDCQVENTVSYENQYGFFMSQSFGNTFTRCDSYLNEYGMYITDSSTNNKIYHNNFYNNTLNAYDRAQNIWDNGSSSGGNFWDDYTGVDTNGDGIGDTPYTIPGGSNKDRYPFMNQNGWIQQGTPVVKIVKPLKALYFNDKKIIPFLVPLIIKGITIEADVTTNGSSIRLVEFYIDGTVMKNLTNAPFSWKWDMRTPLKFRHEIKVIAYDAAGNSGEASLTVWKFL